MTDPLDPDTAALLLRELASELRAADGPARNGLFLELHRLLDTIFRLTLESHPALPAELRGSAFNLDNPMPAPQVVRELNRLESPLASTSIRNYYKHMNMARNTMAHEAVIGRVTVSNSNVKRMAELAGLVADALDPRRDALPSGAPPPARNPGARARFYLLLGSGAGAIVAWIWSNGASPMSAVAVTVTGAALLAGAWLLAD